MSLILVQNDFANLLWSVKTHSYELWCKMFDPLVLCNCKIADCVKQNGTLQTCRLIRFTMGPHFKAETLSGPS